MTDRLLYAVHIASDAQTKLSSERRRRLAEQGVLQSDVSSTESIASQPGQQVLSARAAGKFGPIIAAMVEELFSASGIEVIPYTSRSGSDPADGYYVPSNITPKRTDAREERLQTYDGVLTPKGTRRSHWRAVRTNPTAEDNPFGTSTTPEFGLSIRARKVRWFDDVGGSVEPATPVRRVEGEHDHIDIYDASEPTFDSPVLIYDIPYDQEWPTDCRIWDEYNRPKVYTEGEDSPLVGSSTVGSTTVGGEDVRVDSQWQRVFVTDHDWVGDMVLETDRLRLWIDQPEDELRAYRWSPSDGQYTLVQLGNSPWRLWDVDITHVGLSRLEAQFEFEDTSASVLTTHNLNATLHRGSDTVLWTNPSNEGDVPQGLIDRLKPIADGSDRVANADSDVIERTVVNR